MWLIRFISSTSKTATVGSHYGALEMNFEIMAKDLIHTLQNLGIVSHHIVSFIEGE